MLESDAVIENSHFFRGMTFRSVRICPKHEYSALRYFLSVCERQVSWDRFITRQCIRESITAGGGGWQQRWENSRRPVFSPIQNT